VTEGARDDAFDENLVVRMPRHVLARSGIAFTMLSALAFVLGGSFIRGASLAVPQLGILLGAALLGYASRFPRTAETRVRATREGLEVFGERVPRAAIKTALLRHEQGRTYARFDLKGGRRIDVGVWNEKQAMRLFAAAGMDAMSTTAEFSLVSTNRLWQLLVVLPALFLGMSMSVGRTMFGLSAPIAAVTILAVAILAWTQLRGVKMWVGADGLRVKDGFGKSAFYNHDDITGVASDGVRIDVALKSGPVLSWNVVQTKQPKEEHIELARSIVRRILDARRAHRALDSVPLDAQALARGERSPREWLDALKRMGDGAQAGFREAATSRDALLRVVESTRATAVERLAAALALKPSLTEQEAPRIRIAAERCALPELSQRLRVVVDAATDEDAEKALLEAEAAAEAESHAGQGAERRGA
jgi:hypothetical protein